MFCECDPAASAVLRKRFPDVLIHPDVRELECLPGDIDLVTAGFPCQDLSQAGRANGINGAKSRLVSHLFRILAESDVNSVLIENVPFMLHLEKGQGMRFLTSKLESLDYQWAYRVLDARAFGVPQRRNRVFLLASRDFDPGSVLLDPGVAPEESGTSSQCPYGFYWTEGNRGLGWAVDAVPPIKGGSGRSIPSAPAIWFTDGRIATPDIRDAERLQGFPAGWTQPAEAVTSPRQRWRLVGNAVCVAVSEWIGKRLCDVTSRDGFIGRELEDEAPWPSAAFGGPGKSRTGVVTTPWPCRRSCSGLQEFLRFPTRPLSHRAVTGFRSRLAASKLRYPPDFMTALMQHEARCLDEMRGAELEVRA